MKKDKAPVWARVISALLSILLCILLIVLMTFLAVRMLISEAGLKKLFNDKTAEEIYSVSYEMKEDCAVLIGVSPEELNDKEIVDLVVDICRDVVIFLETGKGQPINSDRIANFIQEKKELLDISDYYEDYYEEYYEEYYDEYYQEYYDEIITGMDTLNQEIIDEYNNDNSGFMNVVRIVVSVKTILVPVAIAIILTILIFLVFNYYVDASFKTLGSTAVATGIFLGFIGLLEWMLVYDNTDQMLLVISKNIIANQITYAVVFFISGIIFKVIGNTIRKNRINRLNEEDMGATASSRMIMNNENSNNQNSNNYSGISSDFFE